MHFSYTETKLILNAKVPVFFWFFVLVCQVSSANIYKDEIRHTRISTHTLCPFPGAQIRQSLPASLPSHPPSISSFLRLRSSPPSEDLHALSLLSLVCNNKLKFINISLYLANTILSFSGRQELLPDLLSSHLPPSYIHLQSSFFPIYVPSLL